MNVKQQDLTVISRRRLVEGLVAAGGVLLAGCSSKELPPTYGNILRMGDLLTYRAFRTLLPRHALVREYAYSDITSSPAVGTANPGDPHEDLYDGERGTLYDRLRAGNFAEWRLKVEGSVTNPRTFSLAELKSLAARRQITKHTCEEGWSAIAEWTGVPLRAVLEASGISPSARFVNFFAYDEAREGIDMVDALHPQTILAYGMNGRDLPLAHGAPLRLRVETQLGYKSVKFLDRIVVKDEFDDLGKFGALQNGWAWYVGI
jgi:DMSO/TMAO reductase YedYZ molybdopterin-dependent catalytic subunit